MPERAYPESLVFRQSSHYNPGFFKIAPACLEEGKFLKRGNVVSSFKGPFGSFPTRGKNSATTVARKTEFPFRIKCSFKKLKNQSCSE